MKTFIFCATAILLLCAGCTKSFDLRCKDLIATKNPTASFTKYTIKKDTHYATLNPLKKVKTEAMNFVVKFDSTAVYQSATEENQYDINKLYGFSDNNADHHMYSARIGWRWSNNQLQLLAYIYNNGVVSSKEIGVINIGAEVACSIAVTATTYVFTVNKMQEVMPRTSITEAAEGYQLYPYFGGDEIAPHDINIWIKES